MTPLLDFPARLRRILDSALLLTLLSVPASSQTVLYDGSLNTLPSQQGWIYGTTPIIGGHATQTISGGATILNTTARIDEQAGYFSNLPGIGRHPSMPDLDRSVGFVLSFRVQIQAENHSSTNRAGFSLIVTTHDLRGIEIGFWTDQLWAQADNPLFTQAEGAAFDNTAADVEYDLTVKGDTYALEANGTRLLSGPLRNYASFGSPYNIADFLFFGDDTSSAAAVAGLSYAAIGPPPGHESSIFMSQVVVGGGYSTVFTLVNTGASASSSRLVLTDPNGNALPVSLTGAGAVRAAPIPGGAAPGSTFDLAIPAGGTSVLTAAASAGDPVRSGWARLEISGGKVSGVATFQASEKGLLKTVVGVLASATTAVATIPVDNNDSMSRYTGFALVNPGDQPIDLSLTVVNADGSVAEVLRPAELTPLGPGRQVARFLHEYRSARATFRGSLVLASAEGRPFTVVALVQDRGLFTAIPVIRPPAPASAAPSPGKP